MCEASGPHRGRWKQPPGNQPPRPRDSIEIQARETQARPEWLAPNASRRTGDRDHAVTPHYRGPLVPTAFPELAPPRTEITTPRATAARSLHQVSKSLPPVTLK